MVFCLKSAAWFGDSCGAKSETSVSKTLRTVGVKRAIPFRMMNKPPEQEL